MSQPRSARRSSDADGERTRARSKEIIQPALQKSVETHMNVEAPREHSNTKREADSGSIRFPPEEQQSANIDQADDRIGLPLDLTPTPCPDGQAFCESTDDYPKNHIKDIMKKQPRFLLDHFYDEEEEIISDKFNPGVNETPLCPSKTHIMYPNKAQSKKEGTYFFVVNDDEYKQGVKVETCMSMGECNIPGSLALGYKSHCVQRYIVRTLVVLDNKAPDVQGFVTKPFEFPSCCSCVLTMTEDRFGNRFGVTPVNTSATATTRPKNTKS